ncbi:hypothetical protein USB125703_01359 [Pseudoclavibacter triregionum]|nr:hypothetical protein USB125703_01359 [Pseudoclavibacter triregionum]
MNPDRDEASETHDELVPLGPDSELTRTDAIVPAADRPATVSDVVRESVIEQDAEAAEYAAAFLKKVIRIRGVRIDRAPFLSQELRKLHLDDDTIERAVATTPIQAGIDRASLDKLATGAIGFETNKSAAMSFAAGIPGGFAMLASVPADITQYYVHAFRVMQKLAYLYGWQNFIDDLDEVDDETLGKLGLFLGVMMGVGGASAGLTKFATQVARPAIHKQIASQALTKTVWYGPVKQVLKLVGIKVTKDSFAKTVTKAVPVAGGVISGGMTFVSLRVQSERLQQHLRELPPPGVDAADFRALVGDDEESKGMGRTLAASDAVGDAVDGAVTSAKHLASDAGAAASEAAGKAKDAAAGAAGKAKDAAGGLWRRAKGLRGRSGNGAETPDDTDSAEG